MLNHQPVSGISGAGFLGVSIPLTTNKNKLTMKITTLEQQVIDSIATGDDWDGFPHMTASEISEETNIPMKQLRGVISSLEQKDIIQESELPDCIAWMVCA